MRAIILWICTALAAGPALAMDEPVVAPPPDWVKPVEPAPAPATPRDAPVELLLWDQQVRLNGDTESAYFHSVVRANNPQTVQRLGTVTLPWNPELGTLTVHTLRIIRGDKVIDALTGDKPFIVLRRENNLESAMLDGVLTATAQLSGLQVGDILDVAYTVNSREPVMRGHAGRVLDMNSPYPIDLAHLRVTWDKGREVRWRGHDLPVDPTETPTGLEFTARDVQPLVLPTDAPPRFLAGRQLQYSDFASWADVAALLAPLYDKARVLKPDSPLNAEIERIRNTTSNPKEQAAAALKLVEDQIRYVYLGMDEGALVPTDADVTWTRRFGDCKAKTSLLLALLDGLGIEAQPALISIAAGDGLDKRLPNLGLFNHVMVRAVIGGQVYWLDATRTGDTGLDRFGVPPFHWALPVAPKDATLEALAPRQPEQPLLATSVTLDVSRGIRLPATVHVELRVSGDAAIQAKLNLESLAQTDRERVLRERIKTTYDMVTTDKVASRWDGATGEMVITADGTSNVEWDGDEGAPKQYEIKNSRLGWKANFEREPGPYHDVPYKLEYPYYVSESQTLILPDHGVGFTIDGDDLDETIAGTRFKRRTSMKDGVVTMEASVRTLASEFPASQATAAQRAIRGLWDWPVTVTAPADVAPTKSEGDLVIEHAPASAAGHASKAQVLGLRMDMPGALAEIDKAIELDPDNAAYLELRSRIRFGMGDEDLALQDARKAVGIDPKSTAVVYITAMQSLGKGDSASAIADLTKALTDKPGDPALLSIRAKAYWSARDADHALADSAQALAASPHEFELYVLRSNIFLIQGDRDRAAAEADKLMKSFPEDAYANAAAGAIFCGIGRKEDAKRALGRSIDIGPFEGTYLTRALCTPESDHAARLADIDAALKLNPKSIKALALLAAIQRQEHNYQAAESTLQRLLQMVPGDPIGRIGLAAVMIHIDPAKAREMFADLRKELAQNAVALNNLCWEAATADFELDQALADCQASVAIQPDKIATQDSLAFAELKLGRLDEAIETYDSVIARAALPSSLYGRGIAKLRKGLAEEGQADLRAARERAPGIDDEFADYGITP
ncbi:MAG: DUF3857 domain-containing protein [Alphaproteobacteria bacterium]|nr:DUF3857 domain-containing protein [Alphaproteobacteria bacterium]